MRSLALSVGVPKATSKRGGAKLVAWNFAKLLGPIKRIGEGRAKGCGGTGKMAGKKTERDSQDSTT